jgi:pimeloyl-ACP methyl ester carboxylesterase
MRPPNLLAGTRSRGPFRFRRTDRHRVLAVALCVALAGGVSAAVGAAPGDADPDQVPGAARYFQQPLTWAGCDLGDVVVPPDQECATITVPQDWRAPAAGADLTVAISRTKATNAAARKGILFTNPGGPGGSGIVLPQRLKDAQPRLGAQYDLIGMDPRGVAGHGTTGLACMVDFLKMLGLLYDFDPRDVSPAAVAARQAGVREIADGCAENPLTPYINTWQTAHDIDLVRALLGEKKLNYLGYSYGTWLGAKYAALFPGRTGKVVLDSNTGWMDDLSDSWEIMPVSIQRKFERHFGAYASRQPLGRKYLGTSPAQVYESYEKTRAVLERTDWGTATHMGVAFDNEYLPLLYRDENLWEINHMLAALKACTVDQASADMDTLFACLTDFYEKNRDLIPIPPGQARAGLTQLLSGKPTDNGGSDVGSEVLRAAVDEARTAGAAADDDELRIPVEGVYWAVRCGDGGNWHTPSWWTRNAVKIGERNPFFGYYVYGVEVCGHWSLPAQELPNPRSDRLGKIVLVHAEFDPATAYEESIRDLGKFRGAQLISVDNAGTHGQYGVRGNSCVDDYVNRYLLEDIVPPEQVVCSGLPIYPETVPYEIAGPVDRKAPPTAAQENVTNRQARAMLSKLIK